MWVRGEGDAQWPQWYIRRISVCNTITRCVKAQQLTATTLSWKPPAPPLPQLPTETLIKHDCSDATARGRKRRGTLSVGIVCASVSMHCMYVCV